MSEQKVYLVENDCVFFVITICKYGFNWLFSIADLMEAAMKGRLKQHKWQVMKRNDERI